MPEVEPDSTCLACQRPLRWAATSERGVRGGLPPRLWFTVEAVGSSLCARSSTSQHVPIAEPDRVREWLDA